MQLELCIWWSWMRFLRSITTFKVLYCQSSLRPLFVYASQMMQEQSTKVDRTPSRGTKTWTSSVTRHAVLAYIYIALHAYILYTAVVHLCIKIQLLTSGSVGKTPWRPVVLLLAVSGFCSPTITPTIPRNLRQESGCSRIYNNRTSPRDVVLP